MAKKEVKKTTTHITGKARTSTAKTTPKKKKKVTSADNGYTAKDIYVLEGLEPVRKRPGMYIGSTGPDGLHHLIWEVVDNSIDEAMGGFAHNIKLELLQGGIVRVTDDGRGIPVEKHAQTKKSALKTVMTTLHAGGKFGGSSYKVAGGLHGVGVSVVNALSEWLKAEVYRDGVAWTQEYKRGVPTGKVKKTGTSSHSGTVVTFLPDSQIFNGGEFNIKKIIEHLRQQAFLVKGVNIEIIDQRKEVPNYYGFCFEGGLLSFLKYLSKYEDSIVATPFYVHKQYEDIDVEVALTYNGASEIKELGFANNIYTPEGGMHITGFRSALTRALNDFSRENNFIKDKEDNLTGDDVREGMTAIISVKIGEPQFEGQTKAKLGNPPARTAVEVVVSDALKEYMAKYSSDARSIVGRAMLAAKARKAAKAAKETVLRKGPLESLALPGKLADCSSRDPSDSELFIVEGDSAGGSGKQGRDRRYQAILPLRGKILNVEKSRLDKMLTNNEIKSLIIALGTAIGEDFDPDKARYHKIVIMTDADVDGAHIRTLLLTLFYRYFKEIIERGYLYIAQPPLYQVKYNREVQYAYDEDAKEKIIADINKTRSARTGMTKKNTAKIEPKKEDSTYEEEVTSEKGIVIQRYKGLGEMNPHQLWETTMNPDTRVLKQVTIQNAQEADRLFDVLMGSKVEPRKHFIQSRAATVENLDI